MNRATPPAAIVVGLVLHPTKSRDQHIVSAIIALHRRCVLMLLFLWGKSFCPNINVIVQQVPYERNTLQDKVVHYCLSAQWAQAVEIAGISAEITATGAKNPRNTHMAYSYLGDGVECQRPSTYPLVSRRMELECADRYHALLTFLANGQACKDMFVRRRSAGCSRWLSEPRDTTC